MVRPPVDVHEVDHRPGDDPVDQVPGRATDDERVFLPPAFVRVLRLRPPVS
jgi:hypothetical protein